VLRGEHPRHSAAGRKIGRQQKGVAGSDVAAYAGLFVELQAYDGVVRRHRLAERVVRACRFGRYPSVEQIRDHQDQQNDHRHRGDCQRNESTNLFRVHLL
jgi:hypothetical protein